MAARRSFVLVLIVVLTSVGRVAADELILNTQDFAPFNYEASGVVSGPAAEWLLEHEPRHWSMLHTSLVPTIIDGGYRYNVIPSEAKATIDVRLHPDEDQSVFPAGTSRSGSLMVVVFDLADGTRRAAGAYCGPGEGGAMCWPMSTFNEL